MADGDHPDAAAIREKIASREASLERAALKREAADQEWNKRRHGSVARHHRKLGYYRAELGDAEAARAAFGRAAEHFLAAHESGVASRRTGEAPSNPHTPYAARDSLFAALLAGGRDRVQAAVAALEALDEGTPDRLGASAHYYHLPWGVAGIAAGADDATERVAAFASHLERHDPSARYRRLLAVLDAIATGDEDALPDALARLQEYHARYQADDDDVLTRNLCRYLLVCLALARWRGLSVDRGFEYAPQVPWLAGDAP
jgi:hypothetical protein